MNKQRNIFRRFKNDPRGNVTVMFAVSFVAAISIIGAAFDLSLLNKSKQHAQYLADAAALAALQFEGTIEEKEAVFSEHIQALAQISGGGEVPVTSYVNIEISESALILNAELYVPHELLMLQHLEGFDRIGITTQAQKGIRDIEIAMVIDISSSMEGSKIIEAQAAATLFVEQLLDDEALKDRIAISLVPFGGTVRVPAELSVLLDTPLDQLNDYSENWVDGEWNQCFEYDLTDTQNGIKPSRTYSETPDFSAYAARNPWCPTRGNEFIPLNDEKAVLLDRIDTLTLSDGTGTDHGIAWGIETLNPEWKNRFPGSLANKPEDLTLNTNKILVLMSDGGITEQRFVPENRRSGEPPYRARGRDTLIPERDTIVAFEGGCDRARADNIEVFVIGFDLRNNADKSLLESCATTLANYISADTGDLEGVFTDIADRVSPLRVSN